MRLLLPGGSSVFAEKFQDLVRLPVLVCGGYLWTEMFLVTLQGFIHDRFDRKTKLKAGVNKLLALTLEQLLSRPKVLPGLFPKRKIRS